MPDLEASGPNAEQITYWNDAGGSKWVALHALVDEQIRPLGRRAMDRARVSQGERVLDVGCGCGATTIELGERVGPRGRVTGIDISTAMLGVAAAAARQAGAANVTFENADAQTATLAEGQIDLLYSRFGVMFFADPRGAFANLRRALAPGGRVAFVCWRPLAENPWMLVPLMAVAPLITLPAPPAPDAPGPFSFGDEKRVRDILSGAGFTGVSLEPIDETLTVGGEGDLDRAVDFILQMGPTGAALRQAPSDAPERVAAAVREALAPYDTGRGVRMPSAAWLVTARPG